MSRAKPKGNPDAKKIKSAELSDQPSITSFTTQIPQPSLEDIMKLLKELNDHQQQISTKLDTCISESYLKTSLDAVKADIIKSFDEKIEKMEGKIFELEKTQRQLIQRNIDLKKETRVMHEKIKSVEVTAKLALDRTNRLEQYTRKDSIRILGILETKKE